MNKKTILITGASSGVGLMLAHHFSNAGFFVIGAARRLDKMNQEFDRNENISIEYLDLNDVDSIVPFVKKIKRNYGVVSYLINNAGINIQKKSERIKKNDLNESFNVNAFSPFFLMKEFLAQMEQDNFGRVINITSGAPLNCFQGFGVYSGSKAAFNALTVTAAREYEHKNIKINLMSPGPVKTEMAPTGPMKPEVCLPTVEYLLSLSEDGPTGKFYWLGYEVPLFPDLNGVQWLSGIGNNKLRKVLPA
jgi:NAD(P)-dependent dehydrogenase (short-subunit alcohol dehydrogenase family)